MAGACSHATTYAAIGEKQFPFSHASGTIRAMRRLQASSFPLLQRLLLALLAAAAFVNTAWDRYAFDDVAIVQHNPVVHDLSQWHQLFLHDYWYPFWVGGLYRPLDLLTFAWQWHWSPDQPFWYHLGNVALHALVTLLVFELAQRLLPLRTAMLAAVWFALLPTHVEVVAGLVGRAELGSTLFALAALLAAVPAAASKPYPGATAMRALTAGLATLLALLFKETAITTAGLALLLIWAQIPAEGWRGRVRSWLHQPGLAAIIAASLFYLAVRIEVVGLLVKSVTWIENPLAFTGMATRLRTALWVGWQDLGAMLWPFRLAPDYSYHQIPLLTSWRAPLFWLACAGVLALAAALLIPLQRRHAFRALLEGRDVHIPLWFGLAFAGLAWLPVSNLPFAIGTIRANRLLYLPSAGMAIALAWLWEQGWSRLRGHAFQLGWAAATTLLLVSFFVADLHENRIWQDDATLFPVAVQRAPRSAKAWYLLGYLDVRNGKDAQAEMAYRKAIAIAPAFANAAGHLAEVLDHRGKSSEALQWHRRALELHPTAAFFQALAEAEWRCGHAGRVLELAQHDPGLVRPESEVVIGLALLQRQEMPAALAVLAAAARALPVQPAAHRAYAQALAAAGEQEQAEEEFLRARRLTPIQPLLDHPSLPSVE